MKTSVFSKIITFAAALYLATTGAYANGSNKENSPIMNIFSVKNISTT